MDQELGNCNKVYDIETYKRWQVCVTIKKYNVKKSPYFQIQLFTAKKNEVMKNLIINFQNKIGTFLCCSTRKFPKTFANCYRFTKITKLEEFERRLTKCPF